MQNEQTILLVESAMSIARANEECLRREGYAVALAENGKQALEFLDLAMPSALVLDLMLPDANGMEILQHAKIRYPDLPAVVVTAVNSAEVAAEAMQRGAFDFLAKPVSPARLITTVHNALERKALAAEVAELRQAVGQSQFHNFVGQSAALQAIYRIIDSVAASKAGVFISGESGSGKQLAATAIHKASPRRSQPFVTLHCADTTRDYADAIMAARNGTLLLYEVCDMPLEAQAKLMHFLQTGEIVTADGIKTESADVRILAATSHDALSLVHTGGMREDLYYRLHVVPLEMPSLRECDDDVIMLAQHFLARFNAEEGKNFIGFDADVMGLFRRYDWPGNVRQLENVIRNVTVLHSGNKVTSSMLPADLKRFAECSLWPANQNSEELDLEDQTSHGVIKPLWLAEKEAILHALDASNQDIDAAAALLQICPSTLYRKMQAWKSGSAVA